MGLFEKRVRVAKHCYTQMLTISRSSQGYISFSYLRMAYIWNATGCDVPLGWSCHR